MRDGELFVDRLKKTEQALAIHFGALAENLPGRLPRMFAVDANRAGRAFEYGQTGLLQNFFDVDGFVATALEVLKDPAAYRHLGQAGEQLIRERYSLDTLIPRMTAFYEEVAANPQ